MSTVHNKLQKQATAHQLEYQGIQRKKKHFKTIELA
jgi:hypothetical protein